MSAALGRLISWSVRSIALTLLACAAGSVSLTASAMTIQAKGDVIYLDGPIKPGDAIAFQAFFAKAPAGTYHTVSLSSNGGFIVEAIDIGRIIRAAKLMTMVDASKSVCASACTAIFASGIKRHYANANGITDGAPKKNCIGLGFHDGSSAASTDVSHYSGAASAMMIGAYYEFGVPGAAQVISKAPPDRIFLLSAETALALGIATSIGKL